MDADIQLRLVQRYGILRGFYKRTNANPLKALLGDDIEKIASEAGVSLAAANDAMRRLIDDKLIDYRGPQIWGITHKGVVEYEESRKLPVAGTEHFPPSIIQIAVYGGSVGAIQGAGSTANVQQQINAPPVEVAKAFATLRDALAEVPGADREEVSDALAGLEEQATAEKPKAGLVRSFARTLNTFLQGYGPTIAVIVEFIIARATG